LEPQTCLAPIRLILPGHLGKAVTATFAGLRGAESAVELLISVALKARLKKSHATTTPTAIIGSKRA
jgi:hypothetical protein